MTKGKKNKSDILAEKSFVEIFDEIKNNTDKEDLSVEKMLEEANSFCSKSNNKGIKALYGVSDGKAVGTSIEKMFKIYLAQKYKFDEGNSGSGVDLPDSHINTDIKVTSIAKPQSSSPYKDSKQKIFGLGYNLLIFVYSKVDNNDTKTAHLKWEDCIFVEAAYTADYSLTLEINECLKTDENNKESEKLQQIVDILTDKDIPGNETALEILAEDIIDKAKSNNNKINQGQITISNALQWRMNYGRVVGYSSEEDNIGVKKLI